MGDEKRKLGAGRLKLKGRGHKGSTSDEVQHGVFESADETSGPVKSIEGWIVFVANVHEEAQEEDILDKFGEFGQVNNIHVNLDRRTGFVKGYALVEYSDQAEAETAITSMHNTDMFGQPVAVDWAFRQGADKRRRH